MLAFCVATGARAHLTAHELATGVGFAPPPSARVPLDAPLTDAGGSAVRLRDFAHARPLIIAPVYFECRDLCPLALDALAIALARLDVLAGKDFDVVALSIDPAETAPLARRTQNALASRHAPLAAGAHALPGWHFVTGTRDAIAQFRTAVGLQYRRDDESGRLAHPSGVLVLARDGTLIASLSGVELPARELRRAIVDASRGRVRTLSDRLWLLCHAFDPQSGRYGALTWNVVRSVALVVALALGAWLARMLAQHRAPGGEPKRPRGEPQARAAARAR